MRVEGGNGGWFSSCCRVETERGLWGRLVAHATADGGDGRVEVGMRAEIMERTGRVCATGDTKGRAGTVGLRMSMVRRVMGVGGVVALMMVSGAGSGDIKDVVCMRSVVVIARGGMGMGTGAPLMGGVG